MTRDVLEPDVLEHPEGPSPSRLACFLIRAMIPAAAVVGGVLLFLSLYPHHLSSLLTLLVIGAVGALPLCLVLGFAVVVWLVRLEQRERDLAHRLLSRAVLAAIVLGACGALVVMRIPRRTTFRLLRSSFESALVEAPEEASGFLELRRRIGPWRVDAIARDEGGGVYFRTGVGGLLDPVSYGFVHSPEPSGPYGWTPFGMIEVERITGDWYEFTAQED